MKTKLLLLLLVFGLASVPMVAQGTWNLQTNPTTDSGLSTKFVSATEGWMNLSSNKLLHTTNGGTNWNVVLPSATDVTFGFDAGASTLSFVNPSTGWVIKTLTNTSEDFLGAVVYKTTNSGDSWQRTEVSSTLGEAAIQLQFIDSNNGWLVLYNLNTNAPRFLRTTDGGATWLPTDGRGIIFYVSASVGYSFSAGADIAPPYNIYKTTDGGTNWTPQYADNTAGELLDMQFTDENHGWAVGRNGKIVKTVDGGNTWNITVNNPNYRNNNVFFISNNEGWIASQDNSMSGIGTFMLHTTDGGVTWSTQTVPFNYNVKSMYFWDATHGWAAADYGAIANYTVSSGTYSNASLNGPWFFYTDVMPIDPYNDNLNYIFFDGNGLIIDFNGFGGPWTGTYTVSPSGAISGTLIGDGQSFPIVGQLTSTTEGTGSAGGQNWRFHKIANPSALKDKIVGTLNTENCGSKNVTLNIDNNGVITSATGITGPVTGRVYTDLGVFIGHITTGEATPWHEFSIFGYYNNNNLVGTLGQDGGNGCGTNNVTMVRSDDLGIGDIIIKNKIVIYPNPNNGTFYVNLPNDNTEFQIEIYDIVGHKVYSSKQTSSEINFNTKSKGLYFLKVYDGVNEYLGKIIIE